MKKNQTITTQENLANPRPYQNFIILSIILMAIYALVFFAMRVGG